MLLSHLNPCLLEDGSDPGWYLEVVTLGSLGWGEGKVTILLGWTREGRQISEDG